MQTCWACLFRVRILPSPSTRGFRCEWKMEGMKPLFYPIRYKRMNCSSRTCGVRIILHRKVSSKTKGTMPHNLKSRVARSDQYSFLETSEGLTLTGCTSRSSEMFLNTSLFKIASNRPERIVLGQHPNQSISPCFHKISPHKMPIHKINRRPIQKMPTMMKKRMSKKLLAFIWCSALTSTLFL